MQKENFSLYTVFVNTIIASVSEEITSRGLPEILKEIKPTFNKIEEVRQLLDDKGDYGKNRGRRGFVGRGFRGGGRGEDAAAAMVVDETGVSATAAVDAQARQRLDISLLETTHAIKFLSTR